MQKKKDPNRNVTLMEGEKKAETNRTYLQKVT